MERSYFGLRLAFFLAIIGPANANAKILDTIQPYLGNPTIDISHYQVSAKIDSLPPQSIAFTTKVELKTLVAANTVELHTESSVMHMETVLFEGQPVPFETLPGIANIYGLTGDVLSIKLPRLAEVSESLTLEFHYTVQKADWSDDKGIFYVDPAKNFGQALIITRNWPYYARYWLPSNDTPDDVASIGYEISVPDGNQVAANGHLVEGDELTGSGLDANGRRTFRWEQNEPTTSYNFVFAVGAFTISKKDLCFSSSEQPNDEVIDCDKAEQKIPVILYSNKDNPAAPQVAQQVEKASHAAIYFSKLFGPYEFDKIGFVFSPYPFSMESTSLIVLSQAKSAVHEIVHHWWGDNVHIAHWGDFWISEGFTTYFTGVYDEYKIGTNTSCLSSPSEELNHSPETDPNKILNLTPYCKGAFALHDLRLRVVAFGGNTAAATRAYFRLLGDLYRSHAAQKLSTQELITYVEQNLRSAMAAEGINVSQDKVSLLVAHWKVVWFVL